jgi:predicted DNA-binding transcriptional regulator AlpA
MQSQNDLRAALDPATSMAALSPKPQTRVLRTPAAAEYVGLSHSTLEKFRLTGEGPKFVRIGVRAVGYRIEDLEAWLAERVRHSTSEKPSLHGGGRP